MPWRTRFELGQHGIGLGETRDITLKISESYSGTPIDLPLRVIRGPKPGPALFVTGAIHGDELNGIGVVRELIVSPPELRAGTLVLVPVVNVLGFERHSRYMPDRRDLNRAFPGSATGSLSSRMAHAIFSEIVQRCQYGIDLHSAATHRTNLPNIRADMSDVQIQRIAIAFGCEVIVNSEGPEASMRRTALSTGCATIILEAGEIWKIEPTIVEVGVTGVRNVLIELSMLDGEQVRPEYQAIVDRLLWVRAAEGGLLQFHVAPGDVVEMGQPVATITGLLGEIRRVQNSPISGIVLGMTTLPTVKPGDPICNVAVLTHELQTVQSAHARLAHDSLHRRVRQGLAAGISVTAGDRCARNGTEFSATESTAASEEPSPRTPARR
jgi:hypothetical protein